MQDKSAASWPGDAWSQCVPANPGGTAPPHGVLETRQQILSRTVFTRLNSECRLLIQTSISHIGKLKDFLLQHRKDYINAYSHIMSDYVRMTDTERDQIDQDAQVFMRTCADAIHLLRTEAHKGVQSAQVKEHRTAVLDFIEDYLKRVCKLYSEQRAIRVKRVIDKKRLSKLEPEQSNVSKAPLSTEKSSQSPSEDSEEKLSAEESKDRNLPDAQSNLGLWGDSRGEDELSPEEIQMFEQENQRLVGEMNNLFDEVRQIEGKVVEISRLQEIFTEKVLQQETDIDNIHQLVVGATENIKEGNEDIREKMTVGFDYESRCNMRQLTTISSRNSSSHSAGRAYRAARCPEEKTNEYAIYLENKSFWTGTNSEQLETSSLLASDSAQPSAKATPFGNTGIGKTTVAQINSAPYSFVVCLRFGCDSPGWKLKPTVPYQEVGTGAD
ncbi:hypothetical protein IHE44_0012899 [Lamprotornis superbus]|uniref:Syntaxin-18 n=7 Tax=Telluraves TaxID=3073808 RepID=A0A835NRQ0_9PASS|nr:hypothetical protein IHE44_0012899 [Lamprotornis superbus]